MIGVFFEYGIKLMYQTAVIGDHRASRGLRTETEILKPKIEVASPRLRICVHNHEFPHEMESYKNAIERAN